MERIPDRNAKPKYNLFQNSAWMISLAWRSQKSVLGLAAALAALGVATSLLGLYIAPTILGAVQAGVTLSNLAAMIAAFTAGLMILYALNNYVDSNTTFGQYAVTMKINALLQHKALTTSFPNTQNEEFRKQQQAALTTCGSNDKSAAAVWKTLSDLLKNIGGFVVYLLLLATLNPYVVLLVLVTSVAGFLVNSSLNNWSFRRHDEENDYIHHLSYMFWGAYDNRLAKDIRVFGMKKWIDDLYNSSFELYQAFTEHREKMYLWSAAANAVLTLARNGAAYFVLIRLVLGGGLSVAQFLLYFAAVSGFTAWVGGIFDGFSLLQKQSLDLSVVREFLEFPEKFAFEENGEALEPDTRKSYSIELKDVSFRYPGAEKDTLEHINLRISPGEKLAVVGLNGAGKTTLVKLICGFFDPTEGEVLLNGQNIKKYNRRDIYRHFSAVFQEFSELDATVDENVAQVKEGIDAEKVRACLEKAGVAEKIDSLPKKLATQVGRYIHPDGMLFSGGETQRLMLARALYKDAPIIVLDEPTAALDPIAESDMYMKYNELTAGRTAVYISHRLASTRFCDRIILIGGAKIAEEGSHDALMNLGGKYAELFEIQSRYYREGAVEDEN